VYLGGNALGTGCGATGGAATVCGGAKGRVETVFVGGDLEQHFE